MSTRCTRYGAKNVPYEAVLNPNIKEFKEYTGESFIYGYCNSCNKSEVLTDTDDVAKEILAEYDDSIKARGEEPTVVSCLITWIHDNKMEIVRISLLNDLGYEDDLFFYCQSLSRLKCLTTFGKEDFIITEIHNLQ